MSSGFWSNAGSGLIGALGALGSAGIGAISANFQSGKAFGRMLYAMQEQARLNYDYGQKSLLNSPSSTRQGLVNAGYNPMLAVSNATSGANSGWTSSGAYQQDQQTDAITNGIRNGTDMAQLAINQQQTDSNVKLNEAQARNAISDSIGKEIHNKYLPEREEKELGQIGAATDKLIRETSYYDQLAENLEAQRRLQEMGINLDYRARLYAADKGYAGTVYNADTLYDIAEAHQPSGRSESIKNYSSAVRNVMSGVGDILHGRNDTYENYDESVQHTSRDKKTGVTTTTKSRKTGKRKK